MTRLSLATDTSRLAAARQAPPSRLASALTLTAMSLGFGVVQLDVTIVNTALASIRSALGGGVAELQWVVNAYTIAFAAFILTAGALGDRLGARRIFMGGFALFTLASIGCGLAPDAISLIALRGIQGLGAAVLVPNSLALLNHTYADAKQRGRAVGVWAAGASLALTAGPFVGGTLIALVGWRAIFFVNVPIGLAGLWLAKIYAQETPLHADRSVDLAGQVAAITSLGALAAAVIEAGARGWTDRAVLLGFAIAIAAGVVFVWQEARTRQPMLPLILFRNRLFALCALVGLLANVSIYGLIFVFSLYFQEINHLSAFATGLAFVPMLGVVFPVNLAAPRLAERIGPRATIALGATLSALSCLALLRTAPGTPYWVVGLQLIGVSSGLGLLVPPLTSTLLGSVEKSRSGVAAGVLNATRQTGSVIGVALFGALIGQPDAFISGLRWSLVISAAVLLTAAGVIRWGASAQHGR
ncbi:MULTISPECIES: MFS transporter [unclassified Bradyrhizobium]|uniref:MFS transporter n=1 Tax=unclassified Bradyrhizobium TaxID=2631580 RepID=UPI002916A61F|nr:MULTISPECIES: MFS transporter [unclassified Bradyrhizobium]